ncbi:MAG: MFS transporter [Acidimicrobiales bacterium]
MTEAPGWRPLQRPPAASSARAAGPFARLAAAHGLSMGGDALMTLALAGSLFFSISPSDARGRVALSLLLTMAPFAVVAPFLGPAIDRSKRGRRAMVVLAAVGRAATCLVMARYLDSLFLFPAAFAALILSKAYSVAKSSLVPSAVDDTDELVEANAKLAIVGVLGGFVAAVPGVIILRLLDGRWVLRLGAVAFLAAGFAGIRIEERRAPQARDGAESATSDPVRPHPSIAVASAAMALLRSVVGFLTFLVAFGFRRLDAPSWWFGVVLAASMAAGLAGAAVAPRVRGIVREEQMLTACLALTAVAGLAASQFVGLGSAVVMAAVVGVAASAGKLAFDALVQRDAPDEIRGRSFARFETGFQLVWVVGALMPVVVSAPLDLGFASIGIGCALAAVAYGVVSRRLQGPAAT